LLIDTADVIDYAIDDAFAIELLIRHLIFIFLTLPPADAADSIFSFYAADAMMSLADIYAIAAATTLSCLRRR